MGYASRPAKPNGSTSWVDGDTPVKDGLNGDIDNILTQLNGNIDDTNVKDSAGIDAYNSGAEKVINIQNSCIAAAGTANIAPGKLDQTAGAKDGSAGLDMDIVQSHADVIGTYNTQTSPGDSDTPSLPEHLEDEMERIRYVLQRLNLGVGCQLIDATNAATWFDGCAIGPNLLKNGSFLDNSASTAAPLGWTLVGTPNAVDPAALPEQEGVGNYIEIVDAVGTGGAANEGIEQTLTGLKGETIYLVEARVLPTTDVVKLVTTGAAAASTYDDLDLDSGSGTAAWETLSGIIITDNASPTTGIKVQLLSDATDYSFGVAWASVREVGSTANAATNPHQGTETRGGNMVRFVHDTTNTVWANLAAATELSVVAPGDGYVIEVDACVNVNAASTTARVDIEENTVDKASGVRYDDSGAPYGNVAVSYVNTAPTPGTVYTYRINGFGGAAYVSGTIGSTLRVRLTKI